VCKCVLYYCHRVSTQLHLTNLSYISYRIVSYHISYIISYIISYHHIISYISYHITYHIIYIYIYISYQFTFTDQIRCYRLQNNFCTIGRHSLSSCLHLLLCQTHRYTNTNIRTQQEGITLSSMEAVLLDQLITAARLSPWHEEAINT